MSIPHSKEELEKMRQECIVTPHQLGFNACYYTGRNGEKKWRYELTPENGNRKRIFLARFIFEEKYGPIQKGLYVLHNCGNSLCINIKHLRTGTHDENMKDAVKHGSFNKKIKDPLIFQEICKRYKNENISQHKLAEEYGIRQSYVSNILKKYSTILQLDPQPFD